MKKNKLSGLGGRPHDQSTQSGFISLVLTIIAVLLILHFLGIKVTDILSAPWVKEVIIYMWQLLKIVWADFITIIQFVKATVSGN